MGERQAGEREHGDPPVAHRAQQRQRLLEERDHSRIVARVVGEQPEGIERLPLALPIAECPPEGEALGDQGGGRSEVVLVERQQAAPRKTAARDAAGVCTSASARASQRRPSLR